MISIKYNNKTKLEKKDRSDYSWSGRCYQRGAH